MAGQSVRADCVLVVEDEEVLRQMMEKVLTRAGYRVLEATDGREALQMITAEHESIDVIITDIVMPWMGGAELIEEVRKAGHRMPIICTSGFVTTNEDMQDSVADALLPKPFAPRQLLAMVESVLAKAG